MNEELYNICEMAKVAADMSIPLEAQPVPEAGSEGVMGMTNNATLSPTSQGASVYASPSEQMQLAKAKQVAMCAMAKQAADEKTRWQKIKDTASEKYTSAKDTAAKGYKYVKDKGIAAGKWAGKNKLKAGLGAAAALGTAGGAAYAYGKYKEKQAAADLAPLNYFPKSPEEAYADLHPYKYKARQAAKWVKNNKLKAGLGAAAALGAAGGAAYAYGTHREKQASIYDDAYDYEYADYMDKLASIDETGIYPEEAAYAMDSAEALYNDCLEKMAYAEELYADAADYLDYYDYMEKQANEFVPIAGSALGSAAGATAGAMIGGRFNAPRAGAAIGAAVGGAVGGPAASALENFVATARQ